MCTSHAHWSGFPRLVESSPIWTSESQEELLPQDRCWERSPCLLLGLEAWAAPCLLQYPFPQWEQKSEAPWMSKANILFREEEE